MLTAENPDHPTVRVFAYQADPAGRSPEAIAEEAFDIFNDHPGDAAGEGLTRRYYQRAPVAVVRRKLTALRRVTGPRFRYIGAGEREPLDTAPWRFPADDQYHSPAGPRGTVPRRGTKPPGGRRRQLDRRASRREAVISHRRTIQGWVGDMGEEDRLGLADFLTDLRAELSEAQSRAADDPLKLGVEEITLVLDIVYTLTKGGEASAGVHAKFWVLASAGADVKGSVSAERSRTQQLTLTLKPRQEQVVVDTGGHRSTITRGVDVEGGFAADEERPSLPRPAQS